MNKKLLTKYSVLLVAGLGMVTPAAFSAVMPAWVGTANYLNAPGAGGDESLTTNFDTYDFGNGVGAIVNADINQSVGSTFTGYYQTYVTQHQLNGVGVNVTGLNSTGGGTGFELTMQAMFTGIYTFNDTKTINFDVTGGSAALYFDTTPNYSFTGDSGFSSPNVLLTGTIDNTGSGTLKSTGIGVSEFNIAGAFGNAAPNVYVPNTIDGGIALFTINLRPNTPILNGVSSVMGKTSNLYAADGSLQLTAVPLPATVWLLLSALMGLLSVNKRKQIPAQELRVY